MRGVQRDKHSQFDCLGRVQLITVAMATSVGLALRSTLPSPSLPPLVSSKYAGFPSSDDVERDIAERFHVSPFRYFVELKGSKDDLMASVKVMVCELVEMGSQAPILTTDKHKIGETLSHLNVFLSHCRVHPHEEQAYDALSDTVNNLQGTLSRLYARPPEGYKLLAAELDARLRDFSRGAEGFFVYEARKYAVVMPERARIPYETLSCLTGHPEAFIFDIDDCVIMSEEAHKECWERAVRGWAQSYGFLARDPDGVERMCRSVKYCLDKDRTSNLLQLLCDIAARRGFNFHVPQGQKATVAIENELITFRAGVMVDYVRSGRVHFSSGGYELVQHSMLDGRRVGLFTNTPREVSEPMLEALFERKPGGLSFDETFPENVRVFGNSTPHRKPFPLGWLVAAKALGVRPSNAVIFDNSFNNCAAAAELASYYGHPDIANHDTDLLRDGEHFAAVVGITNSSSRNDRWSSWACSSPRRPVKVVLKGMDGVGL